MFRFALIAYLSFTTVFRPVLCCCLAKELFSSTTCCKNTEPRTPVAASPKHKAHKGCRGHAKSDPRASEPHHHPRSEQPTNPCDQEDQKCPCGKSYSSMACMVSPNIQASQSESQGHYLAQAFDFPASVQLHNGHYPLFIEHRRESGLYGREMLRAYQIMRC